MPPKMKKIGIFGGSFDPPHIGHLIIAELARRTLDLEIVYLVPAYRTPHKAGNHASTASDRLTMTRLSVRGNPGLRVSDIEIKRKGLSYTVDTVRTFHRRYPASELFLIIGSDGLQQFHSWKDPQAILALATLAVYRRPHRAPRKWKHSQSKLLFIKGPMMELASSDIRKRIFEGKTIHTMVRENVLAFITRNRLYQNSIAK